MVARKAKKGWCPHHHDPLSPQAQYPMPVLKEGPGQAHMRGVQLTARWDGMKRKAAAAAAAVDIDSNGLHQTRRKSETTARRRRLLQEREP
jgi:hypothetical protein